MICTGSEQLLPSWESEQPSLEFTFLPSTSLSCPGNGCVTIPARCEFLLVHPFPSGATFPPLRHSCSTEIPDPHQLQGIDVTLTCGVALLLPKMEHLPASIQQAYLVQTSLLTLPQEIRLEILRYCLLTSRNRWTRWIISSIPRQHYARGVETTDLNHPLRTNPMYGDTLSPTRGLVPEEIVYQLFPSLLSCCRQLLQEGRHILYRENSWLAVKWSGIADLGRNESHDIVEKSGLTTRWIIDSKQYGRLLGRLRPMGACDEAYMPDVIFSVKSRESTREVRLVPFSELRLVVRALYISSQAPGLASQRLRVQIRLALPLSHCNTQANRVLVHQILLWLAHTISFVRLGSTRTSTVFSDSHLAVVASDIAETLTFATTRRAHLQCQSLASELDEVKSLRSQDRGHDVVARKLFLIIGQATDVIPTYQRLAMQLPDHSRFVQWVSRIRESAAWELATLDSRWFDYIGDTWYNTVLASMRHRLLMALFVKKSLSRSQTPEDRTRLMQTHLCAAEMFGSLGNWSAAWQYLLQAVLMSRETAVVGHSSDAVAINWAMQKLVATYKRVGGDDRDVADFVFAYMDSAPHTDFFKVLSAWAETEAQSKIPRW